MGMKLSRELTQKVLALSGEAAPPLVETISEADFMAEVIALAKRNGWDVYHTRDSRKSAPGFPDCVFGCGPGNAVRLIVAELKVGKNKPTTQQYAWLGHFEGQGVQAYVWYPADWLKIEKVLAAS